MPGTTIALSEAEARAISAAVDQQLIERANAQKIPDPIVRDILPKTDLVFTNEVWEEILAGANAYNQVVTALDLKSKKLIAFMGVKNRAAAPVTTAVKFTLGSGDAKVKDIWEIEAAEDPVMGNKALYVQNPVIYNSTDIFSIYFYARAAATDNLILLGRVCESRGETIVGGGT